jgi:hypothetical protein
MEKLRDQNAPTTSDRRPQGVVLPSPVVPGSTGLGVAPQGPAVTGSGPTGVLSPGPVPGAIAPGYGPVYAPASVPGQTGIPMQGGTQPAAPGQYPNGGFPQQDYNALPGQPSASPPAAGYGYGQGTLPASGPGQQAYPSQPASPSPYPLPTQGQSAPTAGVAAESGQQNPPTNNNAAWIVGGLGVAVLATGGIFTILSQSAFSNTANQYDASKEKSGKTYAYIGAACYGVGAAGVVTAAIMLLVNDHHSSSSIAVAPIIRPDAMGAVVHYTY